MKQKTKQIFFACLMFFSAQCCFALDFADPEDILTIETCLNFMRKPAEVLTDSGVRNLENLLDALELIRRNDFLLSVEFYPPDTNKLSHREQVDVLVSRELSLIDFLFSSEAYKKAGVKIKLRTTNMVGHGNTIPGMHKCDAFVSVQVVGRNLFNRRDFCPESIKRCGPVVCGENGCSSLPFQGAKGWQYDHDMSFYLSN